VGQRPGVQEWERRALKVLKRFVPLRSARSRISCGVCFGPVTGAGAGLLPGWTISEAGMVGNLSESKRRVRTFHHLATAQPTMASTKIRNAGD